MRARPPPAGCAEIGAERRAAMVGLDREWLSEDPGAGHVGNPECAERGRPGRILPASMPPFYRRGRKMPNCCCDIVQCNHGIRMNMPQFFHRRSLRQTHSIGPHFHSRAQRQSLRGIVIGSGSGDLWSLKPVPRLSISVEGRTVRSCREFGGNSKTVQSPGEHGFLRSGGEVKGDGPGRQGQRLPAVNLSQPDLAGGQERPEQHGHGLRAG